MGFFSRFTRGINSRESDDARLSPVEEELRAALAAMGDASGPVRYAMRWTGTVQCVGFRWSNQMLAQQRGLTGWVLNMEDGSVTMEIQGAPRALARHLAALHAQYARFSYRIWLDEAACMDLVPGEDEFAVRYSEPY